MPGAFLFTHHQSQHLRFCLILSKSKHMEKYLERIGSDPKIMLGKPLIKGTRITVEGILCKLSERGSTSQVLEM